MAKRKPGAGSEGRVTAERERRMTARVNRTTRRRRDTERALDFIKAKVLEALDAGQDVSMRMEAGARMVPPELHTGPCLLRQKNGAFIFTIEVTPLPDRVLDLRFAEQQGALNVTSAETGELKALRKEVRRGR